MKSKINLFLRHCGKPQINQTDGQVNQGIGQNNGNDIGKNMTKADEKKTGGSRQKARGPQTKAPVYFAIYCITHHGNAGDENGGTHNHEHGANIKGSNHLHRFSFFLIPSS